MPDVFIPNFDSREYIKFKFLSLLSYNLQMSSTSPQFDYDSESTATNSNTKEKRKFFNNTDEFSDCKKWFRELL